jgi:branched-subunit amino acid aminotransferase/4-amino-4-deoxychorismate lyase
VFWIDGNAVCTPPIASPVLPGVTRAVVMEICQGLGIPTREAAVPPQELLRAQAVFLSLTTMGIVEAISLDGQPLNQSSLPGQIRAAYEKLTQATLREP